MGRIRKESGMGTPVGRVEREFILNNVNEKRIPVKLNGFKKTRSAIVLRVEEDRLVLYDESGGWEEFGEGEEIRIFFSYFGHVMTFPSIVLEAGEYLHIKLPKEMVKNLQRKYERIVLPKGSMLSFTMENTTYELSFPKTEEYNPAEQPAFSDDFPEGSLDKLMEGFARRMTELKANYAIQMFRDRSPKGWEEEIITRTGKSLFVSPIQAGLPEHDPDMSGRILTRNAALSSEYNLNMSEFIGSKEELDERFAARQTSGLKAEIYCPLIYRDYVIGYAHVWSEHVSLGIEAFEYVYQFSKVLVYTLKHHSYFENMQKEHEEFAAEILDISASGLLFTHTSPDLQEKLVLYTDLDLALRMGPRRMTIGSRIMRKYQDRERTFFGCQFIELKPEDFRFLFDAIYGRELTREDEELWEGGADPPELTLI
jgi:Protein of unknown function (DUF1577)/PilZ domain